MLWIREAVIERFAMQPDRLTGNAPKLVQPFCGNGSRGGCNAVKTGVLLRM
jgi:hypothetical protein